MTVDIVRHGSVSVLQPDGMLTADTVAELSEVLARGLTGGQPRVLIDLARVPLLDSATLEVLLERQESCTACGGVIKLCGATPLCREILHVTGAGCRFELFDNQMTALGSFAE